MENEKNRINIEDLPKAEEELTDAEAKNVQGGLTKVGVGTLALSNANTYSGNTIGGSLAGDPANPSRKMGDGSV